MKRTLGLSFAALAAVALFAGLVHAVLVATGVSEPAATTVYGPTYSSRRARADFRISRQIRVVVVMRKALGSDSTGETR